ncbi:MAG: hypothetical protein R2843_15955 [Thermomicrobiales bacterium]
MTDTGYTIRDGIQHVVEGKLLSQAEAESIMDQIMSGETTGAQIGALVTALRMRGETIDEIAGCVCHAQACAPGRASTSTADRWSTPAGTGGDAAGTFNISTTASFAIAADGVRVASGNRAMTSKCGSADLLEELGVDRTHARAGRRLHRLGRDRLHVRAEVSSRPCAMSARLVARNRDPHRLQSAWSADEPGWRPAPIDRRGASGISGKLAEVLGRLGSRKAVLVHAEEGLDELGLAGVSQITEWDQELGEVRTYSLTPEDVGLERATIDKLQGGDRAESAKITRSS